MMIADDAIDANGVRNLSQPKRDRRIVVHITNNRNNEREREKHHQQQQKAKRGKQKEKQPEELRKKFLVSFCCPSQHVQRIPPSHERN
jgi:hypothetical protein